MNGSFDKNPCKIYIFRDALGFDDVALRRAGTSGLDCIASAISGKRSPKACRHSLAGALLLLFAAENSFGLAPAQTSLARSANGKPFFAAAPELCFNLSHSGGAAVCITAPFPVGVDIERERNVDISVMRRVCTRTELADIHSAPSPRTRFLCFWTLKESYVKATGDGMSFPMKHIEFTITPDSIRATLPGCFFQTASDGYIISAAALIPNALPQQLVPELIEVDADALKRYLE